MAKSAAKAKDKPATKPSAKKSKVKSLSGDKRLSITPRLPEKPAGN